MQNLLKIARMDAGAVVLEKKAENVSEMMERIQSHFAFRAKQEGKEIFLAGDTTSTLFCDREWLTEAINNIVKNALDHTMEGGRVQIQWKQLSSIFLISIRDNGSGIHPEVLYHIFKRFYHSRFSMDTQGVGLGLPLTKAIVEQHSGTIKVESKLGIGTTFIMEFLISAQ